MLEYLHVRGLEMLKAIVRIFDENSIRYFCCGGTLLGAATTGKFIPWDDDVDLCVLDDDYERMLSLLSRELNPPMKLQWRSTEPAYFHGWAKVRDLNSKVSPSIASYSYNGVWVDIYKLAKCRSAEIEYLVMKEHWDYLERRLQFGDISKEEWHERLHKAGLSFERIKQEKERSLSSSNDREKYMIMSASKIVLETEWVWGNGSMFDDIHDRRQYGSTLSFECLPVKTFFDYRAYLVKHYGASYETVPADELRRVGINNVEYGN